MTARSFPQAPNDGPTIIRPPPGMAIRIGDVIDDLPEAARAKLVNLRQRAEDAGSLARSVMEAREEQRLARQEHQSRIDRLMRAHSAGGYGLQVDDLQVVAERTKLDKVEAEFKRLNELSDARHSQRSTLQRVLDSIEQWLRGGLPRGTVIEPFEGPSPPQLKKGENVSDAVEARRRRIRELRADLHRVRSSPYPSNLAMAKAKAQIAAMADQGAPSVLGLIENLDDVSFPTKEVPALVYNSTPGAVVAPQIPDAIGLVAWLFRDQLLKALDKEIEDCSDDAAALTDEQRQKAEVTILADVLAVERDECALIETATAQGINIAYRPDTSALSVLGLTLVAASASQ